MPAPSRSGYNTAQALTMILDESLPIKVHTADSDSGEEFDHVDNALDNNDDDPSFFHPKLNTK